MLLPSDDEHDADELVEVDESSYSSSVYSSSSSNTSVAAIDDSSSGPNVFCFNFVVTVADDRFFGCDTDTRPLLLFGDKLV